MDADSSVISKSGVSVTSNKSTIYNERKEASNTEALFSFFDQVSQKIKIPSIMYQLAFFYSMFQQLVISLWIPFKVLPEENKNLISYLERLAFFVDSKSDYSLYFSVFITIVLLSLLSLVLVVFQVIYFKKNRRFMKWSLYPTRFVLEFLPPVLLSVISNVFAYFFPRIESTNYSIIELLIVVMSGLSYLYLSATFTISHKLSTISINIEDNSFSSYDSGFLINIFAIHPIFRFISIWFSRQEKYTWYFHYIIHILFTGYSISLLKNFPFVSTFINVLSGSLSSGLIISTIISLLPLSLEKYYPYHLIGIIILSYIIFHLIHKNFVSKVVSDLAYDGSRNICESKDAEPSIAILGEDEKNLRLSQLGFETNSQKMKNYLHYGLANYCDMFIDFSLFKYLSQILHQTRNLCYLLRIVCFFPSESQIHNKLSSLLSKKRDISFTERFLIFQDRRIKLMRQSSSSCSAIDKLMKMKQLTQKCEIEVKSLWNSNDFGFSSLEKSNQSVSQIGFLWEEAIKDFPNSTTHLEEYNKFLIECSTDFGKAVLMKYRANLIETGQSFSIDYCYKSMIRCYPGFLKKKILDVHGNQLLKKVGKGTNNHSSNNHSNLSSNGSSSQSTIDAKLEEEIARSLFQKAKTRLALQDATQNFVANSSSLMSYVNSIVLIISVISFIVVFIVLRDFFTGRRASNERTVILNNCHFGFSLSTLFNILYWANGTSPRRVHFSDYDLQLFKNETGDDSYFKPGWSFSFASINYNTESRKSYRSFISSMTELALSNVNIYELTTILLSKSVPIPFCVQGTPMNPVNFDFKSILAYQYLVQSILISKDNFNDWWTNEEYFCSLFSTFPFVTSSFQTLRFNVNNHQKSSTLIVESTLNTLSYAFPITNFLVCFFPIMVMIVLYYKEITKLFEMMKKIDIQYRQSATQPLSKSTEEEENLFQSDDTSKKSSMIPVYIIVYIFFLSIVIFISTEVFSRAKDLNTKFFLNSQWSYLSSMRSSLIADSILLIIQSIFLEDATLSTTKAFNKTYVSAKLTTFLSEIQQVKEDLLMGTSEVNPLVGNDDIIDSLAIQQQCTPPSNADIHDVYSCGSANQQIALFSNMLLEMSTKINEYNASLSDFSTANLFHLTMNHLLPILNKMDQRLTVMMIALEDQYDKDLILYTVLGLFSIMLMFSLSVLTKKSFDRIHSTAFMLLRRVPPAGIISNQELTDYLIGRSSSKKTNESTITETIIHKSTDGIICMNINGIIEEVSQAVTSILGHTPEQLLGQNINTLFDESYREKLSTQLKLMLSKQSALTYDENVLCLNNNEEQMHCHLSIHGMTFSSSSEIESFFLIIRDESDLFIQQRAAEEAKKQSENLLGQILPRDIIIRLNQGEKDISFVVPFASIMFIDIVKFSEYSATLTPQEILGNLSTVFAAFDECINKYPLLTKIKLIGDVYMCASGLFNPDEPHTTQAEQLIKFGLDALQQLEDVNMKLNANLSVRIGVNSGGPLIAGVLGTDKPVFDIIGDPINVASRLQSTCISNSIQISQATYDLVKSQDFMIEKRGEVFLKGKGKTITYLVKQYHGIIPFTSSTNIGESQEIIV